MTGQPESAGPPPELAALPALGPRRSAEQELDDALYYLRTNCEPCAERHFDKARLLGATEAAIAAIRAAAAGRDGAGG